MQLCGYGSMTQVDSFHGVTYEIGYLWIHLDDQWVEIDYYVRGALMGMDRGDLGHML